MMTLWQMSFTAVWNFWEETDFDRLMTMTKEEVLSLLNDLAQEYSTDRIALLTCEEGI